MVTPIEVGLVVLVLLIVFGAYRLIQTVKPLIVNAVVGLITLVIAGAVGFGVEITIPVVIIVAFGGVPGALLVILLAYLGVVFQPAVLVLSLV